MKKPSNFYSWVRRRVMQEGATLFRCDIDGKDRVVRVKNKGQAVRPSVTTILALKPTKVEACNDEGEILGVWEFPENELEPTRDEPYAPAAGDTDDERALKLVARLLAEAHKSAIGALERVVQIQSDTFKSERHNMSNAVAGMERLLGKIGKTLRVRVASAADAAAAAGAEAEEDPDEWLRNFVGNAIAAKMGVPMNGASMPNGAADVGGEGDGGEDG
jgi:hypothetical protein